MAYSTPFMAIVDQLRTDIASAWTLNSSVVYKGQPETEVTGPHAVISVSDISSSDQTAFNSGRTLGSEFVVRVEGTFASPGAGSSVMDQAFTKINALVALVEAGATYGTHGMQPHCSMSRHVDHTGLQDGSGDLHLRVEMEFTFRVERARG
jgi:hypothetical protein